MCNINVWFTDRRVHQQSKMAFQAFTEESYKGNKDGFGIYHLSNGKATMKKTLKDFPVSLLPIKPFDIVATHQRLGTSGKKDTKNVHPFEFSTLVGMHNGVFHFEDKTIESKYPALNDSYIFFDLLNMKLSAVEKKTDENVKECIESVLQMVTYSSSYSVLFRVKETGIWYYFKNMNRSINFYIWRGLYISTTTRKGIKKSYDVKEHTMYTIERRENEWKLFDGGVLYKPVFKTPIKNVGSSYKLLALTKFRLAFRRHFAVWNGQDPQVKDRRTAESVYAMLSCGRIGEVSEDEVDDIIEMEPQEFKDYALLAFNINPYEGYIDDVEEEMLQRVADDNLCHTNGYKGDNYEYSGETNRSLFERAGLYDPYGYDSFSQRRLT